MSIYGVCDNKCLKPLNKIFSNINLLTNGSFQVWQRGITFDSTNKERYSADRWIRRNFTTKVQKVSNGIRISNGGTENEVAGIGQPLANIEEYLGKQITLSVNVKSIVGSWKLCMIKSNSGAHVGSYEEFPAFINSVGVHTVTFTVPASKSYKYYSIQLFSTSSSTSNAIEVEYIKMEEGIMATKNIKLPYALELAECQRFYNKFPVIYSERRKAYEYTSSKTLVPALAFNDMHTEPTLNVGSITTLSGTNTGVTVASANIVGNKYLTMITLSGDISEKDVFLNDVELNAEIY